MVEKEELRKDALQQGKAVYQAVCVIKHNHLIKQVLNFQSTLMTQPFPDTISSQIQQIEAFRSGIELSDGAIPKKLKTAILNYADTCLDYHRAE